VTEELLTLKDVIRITKISRAQIFRMMEKGAFPRQIRLSSGMSRWKLSTLNEWMANLA
jgi:prophage regulatory protein